MYMTFWYAGAQMVQHQVVEPPLVGAHSVQFKVVPLRISVPLTESCMTRLKRRAAKLLGLKSARGLVVEFLPMSGIITVFPTRF